jgi:hypothetical protein
VQLTEIDRGRARAHYRRRFSAVLVGVVGVAWWIPPLLLTSHPLPWVLALWLLTGTLSAAGGVFLIARGGRYAHALALDYHEQQASEDRFTLVGVYRTRGPTLYRWQSGRRRIECRRDDVPWQPSLGEAARIRYLPRSGAVLEVSTVGEPTAG